MGEHLFHVAQETLAMTSPKDASKASKLLRTPSTPKSVKSVAGSDLAQTKAAPTKKK